MLEPADKPEHGVGDLADVVTPARVITAWKHSVRTGLRNQVLPDLHDHLDTHRNIKGIAERLSTEVLSGSYRASAPEFATIEKRDGIARRMAIPSAPDAMLLQCIVDAIEPSFKKVQPTLHTYYSRSHMPPDVERIDGTFAYPWFLLWPEFQGRILEFATTHSHVLVTDIANYYDTIPLDALRNCLAGHAHVREGVLNLLFFLLEAMVWRPYYVPHSGVGLPQLNFDAPRLLAHVFLFALDVHVKGLVDGEFARWMDDINAGVDSHEQGKRVLAAMQRMVNSQGLQLNTSKSRILTGEEALRYFSASHNRALTVLENSTEFGSDEPSAREAVAQKLRSSYRIFKRAARVGQWEKVQMRYLNLLGKRGDAYAVRDLPELIDDVPTVRLAAFRYLASIGYTPARYRVLSRFLRSGHCADEAGLFGACDCLVRWNIPTQSRVLRDLAALAVDLLRKRPSTGFVPGAGIMLLGKYGNPTELMALLRESRSEWERSTWLSRQVAAVSPLLPADNRAELLETLRGHGLFDALRVWDNLKQMAELVKLDGQLRAYVESVETGGYYPFWKVVIVVVLLSGKLADLEKKRLREFLLGSLSDAHARLWIKNTG